MHRAFLSRLSAAGIDARPADAGAWREVLGRCAYVPAPYLWSVGVYAPRYLGAGGAEVADASIMLYHDLKPVGVWPAFFTRGPEGWRAGRLEGALLPPLFIDGLSPRTEKRTVEGLLEALDAFAREELGLSHWEGIELWRDRPGLSEWHQGMMDRGGAATLRHELYVDLRLDFAEIKARFRKSYRALITSGQKLWRSEMLAADGAGNAAAWEEFRLLHLAAAGRATRPLESWEAQLQAIEAGEAFAVCLRDEEGRMVGGGYFELSATEGLYAVAAYDRSLFDKPLGHLVQVRAVEEMQRRKLAWYRVGARPYPQDVPAATEKELSIARFKEGFGTHLFPVIRSRVPVGPAPTPAP